MFPKFRNLYLYWLLAALLLIGCQVRANEGNTPAETLQTVEAIWPSDGESVDPSPILQWASFSGADHYQIVVLDDDAFPPVVLFDQSTTDTLFAVPQPLPPGSYSWTVFARNANDDDLAQSGRQFWVKAALEAVDPANGAVVSETPTLTWRPYSGATSYQMILLDDDAFPPVVVVDQETTVTSFAVTAPLEAGSYSWTVWAKDANGMVVAELNSQFIIAAAASSSIGLLQISLDTSSIAAGFDITIVAPNDEGPYWGVLPEYMQVAFRGYPISNHLLTPQIFIYPVQELQAVNEGTTSIITSLQTLLQSPQEIPLMPFLPLLNAQQVMHTHVQYLDFQNGQGVRYLTQFDQAFIPINNYELIYTYQGLTSDGKYYVAAILPVSHPSLPPGAAVTGNEPPEFTSDFPAYLANVVAALNPQAANTFTPDLTQLDAMMSSLEIK